MRSLPPPPTVPRDVISLKRSSHRVHSTFQSTSASWKKSQVITIKRKVGITITRESIDAATISMQVAKPEIFS